MKAYATFAAVIAAFTTTLVAQTVTTNIATAPPEWKVVGGQLYNTERSQVWEQLYVEPAGKVSGGITALMLKPVRTRGVGGTQGWVEAPRITGYEVSHEVFLRNSDPLPEGKRVHVKAMKVDPQIVGGRTLETWDVGKPHTVEVVVTNHTEAPQP